MMQTQEKAFKDRFAQMLGGMYRETVPLIRPESLASFGLNRFVLLDTRAELEFQVSHLPGALRIGYQDFDLAKLTGIAKDQCIVVYCSVGYRSERIGERLLNLGYQKVFNLYGGIFAWKNQGRTVLDGSEMPTQRVHTYNEKWSQWLLNGEKMY